MAPSSVKPRDRAEKFFLPLGERLSKTVGQIITVGSLLEGFLRWFKELKGRS